MLRLQPGHVPVRTVLRHTARVSDAEGNEGTSTPEFVCLSGNRVGVCS